MKKYLIIIIFSILTIKISAQVSVIAHTSVPENSIKSELLGKIYSQDILRWSNNFKIVIVDQSADGTKSKFYSFISKDPTALKKEWLRKQVTGETKPPVTASSDEEVIKIVSSTPGAVGYVKSSSVTNSVKVLAVIQ